MSTMTELKSASGFIEEAAHLAVVAAETLGPERFADDVAESFQKACDAVAELMELVPVPIENATMGYVVQTGHGYAFCTGPDEHGQPTVSRRVNYATPLDASKAYQRWFNTQMRIKS